MRLLGNILTAGILVSAVGFAAVAAGFGLDAWWLRCEAMERREPREDVQE